MGRETLDTCVLIYAVKILVLMNFALEMLTTKTLCLSPGLCIVCDPQVVPQDKTLQQTTNDGPEAPPFPTAQGALGTRSCVLSMADLLPSHSMRGRK